MKSAAARPQRGFTIIEVMVAIFLFGLVFAAIYSSWMAILRASKSGLEAAAAVQRSRVAIDTVEQALSCSRAFSSAMDYYYFMAENGDEAMLSFVAKLPARFLGSGRFGSFDVRRVTFSVEPGDSGKELVLRQQPVLLTEMGIDEKEHPIVLAKDVKDFELAFWDVRSADWIDEWTQTNQLPPKVKFTLRWGGGQSQGRQPKQEATCIVTLPAPAVPSSWQRPGPAAGPPGPPGARPPIPPRT